MNTVPNLGGRTCEALIRQEFWLESVKAVEINVLYLKIKDEAWHRFFFDCGTLFWREVNAPDTHQTPPNDLCHYPHVEIGTELGIVGQVIETAELIEQKGVSEIHLLFRNVALLVLHHEYPQDTMTLSVTHKR
jgi:hypothetical protein